MTFDKFGESHKKKSTLLKMPGRKKTKEIYSQIKEAKLLEDEIDKRIAKYSYYSKDINELRCENFQLIGSAINGGLASTKECREEMGIR